MYYITALIIIDMIIKAETNQNKLSLVILLCVQSVLLGTLQECSFCLEAVKGSQVKNFPQTCSTKSFILHSLVI